MNEVKFTDSIDIKRPEKKRMQRPQSRPHRNERTENDIRENIQKGIDHAGGKYVKFDDIGNLLDFSKMFKSLMPLSLILIF